MTTQHAVALSLLSIFLYAPSAKADDALERGETIATTAEPDAEPDFIPTVSLEVGQYAEELSLDLGERTETEERELWNSRLALGLSYPIPIDVGFGQLRGQSSLGLGLVYAQGHWPLHLRQEVLLELPLSSWFALEAGLGTGFQVNLSQIERSYWEVGAPIGARIGPVEVLYYPSALVGFGAETDEVFGGERRHAIANGIAPLNLVARVRFEGLGW